MLESPAPDRIGDLLLDDQLVLGIDRDLNVVAHGNMGMRCHRPAVGDGQLYLTFSKSNRIGPVPARIADIVSEQARAFVLTLRPHLQGSPDDGQLCIWAGTDPQAEADFNV